MQKPILCCPEPAVKNPLLPHTVPDSSKGVPTTPGYSCTNPLFITNCGDVNPTPPPGPVTLIGEDCDGAPVSVTGNAGEMTAVVQAPGTVFKVQVCDNAKDYEKVVLCDATTNHKIAVITNFADPSAPDVSYWDLNTGAVWTGSVDDLETCPDSDTESDAELACDSGTEFLRWFVKKDGVPTGVVFDTDLSGLPYTVTDPAAVTLGKCVAATVCTPTISSAFADDLSALLPGNSISIQKPSCCAIKVTTSAGNFLVRKGMMAYSTADFNCPVTVTAVDVVSGTCDVAEVIVTTQALG